MQPEDHRTEYKLKLTEQLEKEVVGFLISMQFSGRLLIESETILFHQSWAYLM